MKDGKNYSIKTCDSSGMAASCLKTGKIEMFEGTMPYDLHNLIFFLESLFLSNTQGESKIMQAYIK